jgi:hypothetical protein
VIGDRDHRRGGNRCGDELQEGDPGVGRLPQQPGEEGRRHHSDDAAVETPPFAYPAKEVLQRVDTDVVVAVLQRLLGDGADDERQPNRAEQRVVGDEADRVREVPGRAVGDQPARGHDRDEPEEQREQSGARTRTAARGQLRRLCRRPACGRAGGRRARARAGRRPRLAPVVTISTVDYRRRRPHRRSPSRSRAVRDAESSAVRRSAGWSMSWGTCGRQERTPRRLALAAQRRISAPGTPDTGNDSACPFRTAKRQNRSVAATSHAGGGTRTPDTRIMIPLL